MAKKPNKTTPQTPMTKEQKNKNSMLKNMGKMERDADRNDGRDTRMSRDGGTGRRRRS